MKKLILISDSINQYHIIDPDTGEKLVSGGPYKTHSIARVKLLQIMYVNLINYNKIMQKSKLYWVEDQNEYEYFDLILKMNEFDQKLLNNEITMKNFHIFCIDDKEIQIEADSIKNAFIEFAKLYATNDTKCIKYVTSLVEPHIFVEDECAEIGEQLSLPF